MHAAAKRDADRSRWRFAAATPLQPEGPRSSRTPRLRGTAAPHHVIPQPHALASSSRSHRCMHHQQRHWRVRPTGISSSARCDSMTSSSSLERPHFGQSGRPSPSRGSIDISGLVSAHRQSRSSAGRPGHFSREPMLRVRRAMGRDGALGAGATARSEGRGSPGRGSARFASSSRSGSARYLSSGSSGSGDRVTLPLGLVHASVGMRVPAPGLPDRGVTTSSALRSSFIWLLPRPVHPAPSQTEQLT